MEFSPLKTQQKGLGHLGKGQVAATDKCILSSAIYGNDEQQTVNAEQVPGVNTQTGQ